MDLTFENQNDIGIWAREFYGRIDKMNAKSFSEMFDGNGSFTFGNFPIAVGQLGVEGVAQSVFDQLTGIKHNIKNLWSVDRHFLTEGQVEYHRKDGKIIPLPFFSVAQMSAEAKVKNYRAYIDPTPLFTP